MSTSKIVQNIIPSVTGELKGKILQLKASGVNIINLSSGEPDFPTPKNIVDAAKKALDAGETKYSAYPGIMPLREAIQRKFKRDNNLDYEIAQIGVATGAKQAIFDAVLAVVDPGDEVLLPSPCWVSYTEQVKMAHGVPVLVHLNGEDGFALDIDLLEKAVTSKTKAIIINTPNNPTSVVYSKDQLTALARFAEKHNLIVISDEVYEKLVYDEAQFTSFASVTDYAFSHTVTINGVSKSYAMTGWRIGYSAAPKPIARGMLSILGHETSGTNTVAQIASVEALDGPQDAVESMRQEFDARRKYIMQRLRAMEGITCGDSQGAFYAFIDVRRFYGKSYKGRTINGSMDMCGFLLDESRVAFVPGIGFFADNYVRISYSYIMPTIEEGMNRLEVALKLLN